MLTKRDVILVEIESAYNTDPTPTAADNSVLVEEPGWSYEAARLIDRPAARPSLGMLQQIFGGALKTVSFGCEVKGPGAAYSATVRPEIDPLLRACGLAATVDATPGSETVTYAPASTGLESCTVYYYQDGTLHKLTGCRGNVAYSMEAGGKVMANFTMTGHYSAITDTALASPTYDTTEPPVFRGQSFTVGGYAAVIGSLSFDMANKLAMPPSANAADGFGEIRVTGRDVNGSFDPEHTLVATNSWLAAFDAGTNLALATGNIGATQYNRFSVSMPAIYYRSIGPGDRDGIRSLDVTFAAAESTTDDEVTIVFS